MTAALPIQKSEAVAFARRYPLLVLALLLTVLPTLYARYGRRETDIPASSKRPDAPTPDLAEAPL